MSVRLDGDAIRLEGRCRIEDAETLLGLLVEDGRRSIDLSLAGPLHSAVVQILMAAKPIISGRPDDPFLCAHVLPLLDTHASPSDTTFR
jgi:hypothetical protein